MTKAGNKITREGLWLMMIKMLMLMRSFGPSFLSTNSSLCCFPGTLGAMIFAVGDSRLEPGCGLFQSRCRGAVESGAGPQAPGGSFLPREAPGCYGNTISSGLALGLTLPHSILPSSLLKCSFPIAQTEVKHLPCICLHVATESIKTKQ